MSERGFQGAEKVERERRERERKEGGGEREREGQIEPCVTQLQGTVDRKRRDASICVRTMDEQMN